MAFDDGQLFDVANERHHDFQFDFDTLELQFAGRLHHGPHLHAVDVRVRNSQAAATVPEHRVGFPHILHPAAHLPGRAPHVGRQFAYFLQRPRQEFVQGRIQQADRDRQATHDAQNGFEVVLLHGKDLIQRFLAGFVSTGHDHPPHRHQTVLGEKHVLRAAQADALCSEATGDVGVLRRIRVAAHAQATKAVGPLHQFGKVAPEVGCHQRRLPQDNLACCAVQGQSVAGLDGLVADAAVTGAFVDYQIAAANDATFAHAARHHRGMAGHASAGRQDALRSVHAADVFRRRFVTNEQDTGTVFVPADGVLRREHGLAACRPGRSRQPSSQHLQRSLRVNHRMQQLVDLRRLHAHYRFAAVDQPFVRHLHRDTNGGRRRAFAGPRLQQVQGAVLYGELNVLHVAEMQLQPLAHLRQFVVDFGKAVTQRGQWLRVANAGHHVFTLRVGKKFAKQVFLAA